MRILEKPVQHDERMTDELSIEKWKLLKTSGRSFWQSIRFSFSEQGGELFLKNIMSFLIALLMLGFLFFQINKIATASVSYDDGYNASVAKNLALGHGYATSYNTIKKFNKDVTTGPTLIMPTALFIKVFGNGYWVPNFVASFIIIIMLFVVLWMPSKLGLSSINFRSYCLLVLLFIICYLFKNEEHLWFALYGEVPSSFFAITATMLLFSPNTKSVWHILIAGLFAGAAFLTKTVIAFNIIALLTMFLYWLFLINKNCLSSGKALLYMVIFVAGMAILPGSFEAYKKATLSIQDYKALRVEASQFLDEAGSGIAQIQASTSRFDYIKKNFHVHNRAFADYTGGTFICCILLAIILLAFVGSLGKSSLHVISYVLLLSSLAHFFWWACLSVQSWIRHLYPALIFLSVGLSILITMVRKQAIRIAIICLCAIFFVPKLNSLNTLIPTRWQQEERLTSLLKAADFIKVNNNYKYVGAGWWAPRELEYILPGINNFKDYVKLTDKEEKEMKNIALVRDVSVWSLQKNIYLTKLTDVCEKILLRSDPFIISLLGNSDCYRVDSASDCTDGNWVNGIARSWATAFFIFNSFHAKKELTVGKKITFADGTTREIVSTKETGDSLIVFLDGAPLDGTVVGYPKKFTVHPGSK